jgi:hypothetical protein
MSIVPALSTQSAFVMTWYDTCPLPTPLVADVKVTHATSLVAVHGNPPPHVMVIIPSPPCQELVTPLGESTYFGGPPT